MDAGAYHQVLAQLSEWADRHPDVIGLVAVGATAATFNRPDEWSDHDLLVVAGEGTAQGLLDDLSWLPNADTIAVSFAETPAGRGLIYANGHLIELAVLEPEVLDSVPLAAHRVIVGPPWLSERLEANAQQTFDRVAAADPDGEYRYHLLIKELVVGLSRYGRGEIISANHRIRGVAVTALVELISDFAPAAFPGRDVFDSHRRFEQIHPAYAERLRQALQASIPDLVDEILRIAEDELAGRIPAVTPQSIEAVRAVSRRARR